MRTGFILGTLMTLATACSHGAGHANSAAALTKTASKTAPKASGCFSAEELAKLDKITNRARICGDEFRTCQKTKPEETCKREMDNCSQKIKREFAI